jgi:hypothetical protein
MNIPLAAPYDQSDRLRARHDFDAEADAARRDLFEYFAPPLTQAPPLTETNAPPMAADVPPPSAADAPPEAVVAEEDEDAAWHHQILAWYDATQDDEISGHEPESPDEIAASALDACAADAEVAAPPDDEISNHEPESHEEIAACDADARTAHADAAPLDEVSKADLRRLETTLSWLQTEAEACRLPPVTPLPLVPGLPAMETSIDRGTLDRTLRLAPPLPAWLREPQAASLPAPPHRDRVLWPPAIKVLMVCAVAAPLSYYFVLATSPLYKRVVEVAAVVSLDDSPVVHAPKQRDRLRMSTAAPESEPAADVFALAVERNVETAAPPKWARLETPIRPIPQLPDTEAFAILAPAVPAQAGQPEMPPVEVPRVEAPGAETPRGETAKAEIVTGPPATAVTEDEAPSPPVAAPRAAGSQDVRLLLDRGKQFFDVGDLIAARILFLRAANAGDAAAAVAMGATYDPVVLAERGVRGVAADLDKARRWYERAREMGSPEGPRRLEMLANR